MYDHAYPVADIRHVVFGILYLFIAIMHQNMRGIMSITMRTCLAR